ncbi:hypothetical protein J2S00_000492 [Caldalkalibacillus uzonensis]|uniref:Uncharacterized protein n=1 Tax=Caldalkalibacillus uzonensis TaxID=353224 RepID=A0ABU0CNJ3_9BACI|nr:hypothetical protein [Caldalkalibacillus uzonensis]MDQ0337722.1 hypothetical protein [Caldalkalibacillus uzonensis]
MIGKHYGLGPVGFPKQTPPCRQCGGFPLSPLQRCHQTLDWITT